MPKPQTTEQDAARPILDPIAVDQGVKRQAWDAFHKSQSPEEFHAYFDKAPIPQESKRALWDAKFGAGKSKEVPQTPPAPEKSFWRTALDVSSPLTMLGKVQGKVGDWAAEKAEKRDVENLHMAAQGGKPSNSQLGQVALRSLADVGH